MPPCSHRVWGVLGHSKASPPLGIRSVLARVVDSRPSHTGVSWHTGTIGLDKLHGRLCEQIPSPEPPRAPGPRRLLPTP